MPDYAIFNINYRLVNGSNLFPTQEHDVKTAIDFIVTNSTEYHVNKNKLVLLGVSAGGHLALLQGYKCNNPKVAAIIDFFGPTDLLTMFQKPWNPYVPFVLQMITGKRPGRIQHFINNPAQLITSIPSLLLFDFTWRQ